MAHALPDRSARFASPLRLRTIACGAVAGAADVQRPLDPACDRPNKAGKAPLIAAVPEARTAVMRAT